MGKGKGKGKGKGSGFCDDDGPDDDDREALAMSVIFLLVLALIGGCIYVVYGLVYMAFAQCPKGQCTGETCFAGCDHCKKCDAGHKCDGIWAPPVQLYEYM